jgi:hypothetical protein
MNNRTISNNLKALEGHILHVEIARLNAIFNASQPNLHWKTPEAEKNYLIGQNHGINLVLQAILQE